MHTVDVWGGRKLWNPLLPNPSEKVLTAPPGHATGPPEATVFVDIIFVALITANTNGVPVPNVHTRLRFDNRSIFLSELSASASAASSQLTVPYVLMMYIYGSVIRSNDWSVFIVSGNGGYVVRLVHCKTLIWNTGDGSDVSVRKSKNKIVIIFVTTGVYLKLSR